MKIKFTTANEGVHEHFKPEPIKLHLPQWFKDTPRTDSDPTKVQSYGMTHSPFTVTSCIPVRDYMMSGYVLFNTADRVMETIPHTDPEDFSDYSHDGRVGFHRHGQCPVEMDGKRSHYFKILNPWVVHTPKGYSCMFYQPEYFFESRFRLLPAIVDTDTHTMPVNFTGAIKTKESFVLKAGEPLMVVFPFKRDEWESETECKEVKFDNRFSIYFNKVYKRFFHTKKVYR